MRPAPGRRAAAAALAALGAVVLAGCGGGGDGDAAATSGGATAPEAPAETVVRVTNGDTDGPVADARVQGVAEDGAATAVRTDARGVARLPAGTVRVRVRRDGWSVGTADVRRGAATVRLYDQAVQSPQYGGNAARTRYVPAVRVPAPRGRPAWSFDGRTLVEFPPAVRNGLVVFGTNSGRVFALDARSGEVRWARREGGYIASSPAIAGSRVYVTAMDGTLTAYTVTGGRRTFRFSTGGSPIESSPLIVDDTAYIGAWNGRVYAVDLRTGRARWTFQAADDVKGSAALAGGRIVVADYAGNVYALAPRTGAVAWRYSGGRRFYGGPGIAGGTVVIGDVGGAVIALDAATGRERWRHSTGGAYVYSSPAIANGTVFIGSYNGRFEALDLGTGNLRWSFDAGGRISGSATVVGDVVYTAVLTRPGEPKRTWGLDVRTGAVRYRGDDGRYSPAVAAGRTLYLVGTRHVYAHPAPR